MTEEPLLDYTFSDSPTAPGDRHFGRPREVRERIGGVSAPTVGHPGGDGCVFAARPFFPGDATEEMRRAFDKAGAATKESRAMDRRSLAEIQSEAEESDCEEEESGSGDAGRRRACIICLAAPVDTLLLPCRHAVMCEACVSIVRGKGGRCPVCRAHIAATRNGCFDEEYVEMVPCLLEPLEVGKASLLDGMYQNIRAPLLLGAASGIISALLLSLAPESGAPASAVAAAAAQAATEAADLASAQAAAPSMTIAVRPLLRKVGAGLAAVAVCAGYLPWFAVTTAAFESAVSVAGRASSTTQAPDLASGGSDVGESRRRGRLTSAGRLRRMLTAMTKVVLLLAGVPVACALFFVPYAFYAGCVRPLIFYAVPCILRAATRCALQFCLGANMLIVRPIILAVMRAAERVFLLVRSLAKGFGLTLVAPFGKTYNACSRALYTSTCFATGRYLSNCTEKMWCCAQKFAVGSKLCAGKAIDLTCAATNAVYSNVIQSSWYACLPLISSCWRGAAHCASWLYDHSLAPVSHAAVHGTIAAVYWADEFASAIAQGIEDASDAVYRRAVAPISAAALALAGNLALRLAAFHAAFYVAAVAPLGVAWARLTGLADVSRLVSPDG
eukprot:TRINITY_DN21174_c0_g4_i1.p1 TRINITY_DN21174_c0_g4~~TRINITY_DN21174_c0_g4_i1.p1  ORF type:complete len:640 (-),score=86.05 TRINITY_DN21174_c0_g4_i1:224-2068(-)